MSLVKQLWLAIAMAMAVAFAGSLVVSVLSARDYLQQQLQVKNIDNATSLALSLTQMEKDPVSVELLVSAQFDVGHYRFIRLTSPTGEVLVERVYEGTLREAPEWFARLIPIRTEPGRALVQDGWNQYGTLLLASHDQYAYQSLWQGTLELLAWFLLGAVGAGLLGTLAVRVITRPLGDVVAQANAITERRFLSVQEPRTPELRAVTRAMNTMVERLRAMFAEEATRLDDLRKKVNRDPVTGLANRAYFLSHLREALEGESYGSVGTLVVLRLADLVGLNEKLGHQRTDELLHSLGRVLYDSGTGHVGQRAGRLNGGDFALLCPSQPSPSAAAQAIATRVAERWLPQWQAQASDLFHLAAVRYERHDAVADVLARADQALAVAMAKGPNSWHAEENGAGKLALPAEHWRTLLTEAVQGGHLSLAFFPVKRQDNGQTLHQEGVIRLLVDESGQWLPAGDFMPMAAHLNLTAPLDLGVVKLAIEHLQQGSGDVAVNLSAETVSNFQFRNELMSMLRGYPDLCRRLLFEVPEYGVFRAFEAFHDLVRELKALGCRVGIEYFGLRFAESSKLADLGLDYIKVHPSYIRGIASSEGNQEFLKGLCKMAHALGIQVIALGVEQPEDLPLLARLGFDGATGPGIR